VIKFGEYKDGYHVDCVYVSKRVPGQQLRLSHTVRATQQHQTGIMRGSRSFRLAGGGSLAKSRLLFSNEVLETPIVRLCELIKEAVGLGPDYGAVGLFSKFGLVCKLDQ